MSLPVLPYPSSNVSFEQPLIAKKAIGTIKSGDVMEILSSDEGTKQDIPKWCGKQGHEYLGFVEENGYFKVYMKKQ
jgi:TusA-related sulfurtransferase